MKRIDLFTKVMLAAIAAGLWVLILRSYLAPGAVRAATKPLVVARLVRAERFEVVDSSGKLRAWLGMRPDEGPALVLLDRAGRTRAELSLKPVWDEPELRFRDERGTTRAKISLFAGTPLVKVYDEGPENAFRSNVGLSIAHGPEIYFADDKGTGRLWLGLDEESGRPSIGLADEQRRARAVLGVAHLSTIRTGEKTETAESSFVLFDKDGSVLWKAP